VPFEAAHLAGPVVALGVVGVLALILRWAYSNRPPDPPQPAGPDADFGLLTEIASVPAVPAGREIRALLSGAGIRSTMTTDRSGRTRVLVFAPDAERARRLVGPGG
jgi:hypothetical protein